MHNGLEEIPATATHVETAQTPHATGACTGNRKYSTRDPRRQKNPVFVFFFPSFLWEARFPKTKAKQMFEFPCFSSNHAELFFF